MRDKHLAAEVVLVSMPFMDAHRPSIQLGLLKALAEAHGFSARTLHANLHFAAQIGADYYRLLAEHRRWMIGDWLFSLEAYPAVAPDPGSRMLDELGISLSHPGVSAEELRKILIRMRQVDVPAYLATLLEVFPWQGATVVGFSSTFQQNTASFAFARRLKQRYPHIFTLFGGANFDGSMGPELVRTNECVDAAVIGEADDAFPLVLEALAAGADLSAVPGIARRLDGRVQVTPPLPPVKQMDDLPAETIQEIFGEFQQRGLMFLDEQFALALALPAVKSR